MDSVFAELGVLPAQVPAFVGTTPFSLPSSSNLSAISDCHHGITSLSANVAQLNARAKDCNLFSKICRTLKASSVGLTAVHRVMETF
jgi:hypothetical protein